MSLLEWKPEFALGIPSVDYEHQELIALINELHDGLGGNADPRTIAEFMGEVHARIGAHFALEERIMRDMKYADAATHKDDHENLLDDIRALMDAYEDGEFDNLDDRLSSALQGWFTNHFATHDAALHRLLGDNYPGVEEI